METTNFLKEILPREGFYCLARPATAQSGRSYFKHHVVENADEMASVAMQWARNGEDTYYAMASLHEPRVFDPKKGEKGGYRVRTKANIAALRCVFFELDVLRPDELETATEDELARKYTDRKEALAATKEFVKMLGWPSPMVVSSGWGFHLYWLLEDEIEPSKYEVMAKKLKLVAKKAGYKLDSQAADMSRVFRVPGTFNFKNREKPQKVTVLKEAPVRVPFSTLMDAIEAYIEENSIAAGSIVEREYLPDYLNFDVASNVSDLPEEPMQLDRIASKCGAIKDFLDANGAVSYQYWLHSLQVIRHCEGGRDLCHEVSANAPSYDEDTTDKILDSLEEKHIPPTLCDTFAGDSDCTACAECPYRHKVRSPASFGRDVKSYKQNAQQAMIAATGTMPPPPWPFSHQPGKGVMIEVTDKEGVVSYEPVFDYDMLPIKRIFSERDQRELTLWETNNPADGFVEIEMPSAALYDKRNFQSVLADCGVYCNLAKVDYLRQYMIAYIQELQRVFQKEMMYSRMGWRDGADRFVYAGYLYQQNTIQKCEVERHGRVVDAVSQSGTLDGWREIMDYFRHPDFVGHQFAIGTAFGALLMPFTGISGGIINMIGDSGEGKSTAQKVVNSVWGHPHKLMLPAEAKSSTYNAKISFINQMNNLPICAEEITNATPEELGSLAYAITQGSEKWRADQTGKVRESAGGWCTTMLSSANSSLHEKLHETEGSSAKALRVLEYRLQHVKVHSKADFRQGVDMALMEHYGVAGHEYLAYLVQNLDDVKERIRAKMAQIDNAHDMQPEERVWTAVIATNLIGLEIAQELSLHDFSMGHLEKFVASLLNHLRGAVSDMQTGPVDQLSQFVAESVGNMLVVDVDKVNKATFTVQKPYHQLAARYDISTGELTVAITALRKWCREHNVAYARLLDDLTSRSVVKKRSARITLGAGTDVPSTQTRVVVFDAQCPALSGTLRAVHAFNSNTGKTA